MVLEDGTAKGAAKVNGETNDNAVMV